MNWQTIWSERAHFVIFDAAYGDGAAFQKTLHAWRNDPQRPARLHYIALANDALPGYRRIPQIEDAVTLDLLTAPLDSALEQLTARLDAIWLHDVRDAGTRFAHALGKLAAPGALLDAEGLTHTQMESLAHAGFAWEPGVQRAVYASRRPQAEAAAPRARHAIVIGAGLAGAAACERLCARGWKVTLIERHAQPAQEASGNRAGISMPLLSRDDNLMTRLSRAAFLYAQAYWDRIGENGIASARCGVLQLARDAAHAEVQRAIAAGRAYPPDFAEWLEAPAATELLGASAPDGAWLFRQGGWMRPASACGAMLTACGESLVRHFGAGTVTLGKRGADWCAIDAAGEVLAQAPVLVLANGTGAASVPLAAGLPLAAVRGQVTHLAEAGAPALPFVLCREAYLTPAVGGLHSLGASYDDDADPSLRQASQDENLAKIRTMLGDPALGRDAPLLGRVGFRCVAPDRMPLVGALPDPDAAGRIERLRDVPRHDGVYGLLGYASRGLTWAPLAAELLAAQLNGEPLPLEADLVAALDPARFLLRDRRRGEVG
ncbi:FAD-dependent 5-carboxymethylaminomethyl-2-thiouridine(34) oxidoreductase MnmC [Massilia sp. CCM 8733]|uniref:FAD-dependent 5-carboxymethylaminomethyl-2-thiouridine(34) oxidoreductase MnmC n=1 Tax=Massilia mucilaginosa TaxID=2609282 RepID=A0ABX0NNI4_9BURK|nr:FAD-dependent 5-carboxymethylaminomethyl-2-thiouridine(34) oxidoreductase MnmC [Massilia mucilaginosa]NHZ88404.1 FAD-dependent 5-carboxymethylaminomethyl-2-thiouridine(34) oxidoreductase MnmC [Massilia mucilaginosa]